MSERDEIERINRLRERQLTDRDPGDGFRRTPRKLASRPREEFSLGGELKHLPAKVIWAGWGLLAGLLVFGPLIAFALSSSPLATWTLVAYFLVAIWSAIVGAVLGAAHDKGKEDWR